MDDKRRKVWYGMVWCGDVMWCDVMWCDSMVWWDNSGIGIVVAVAVFNEIAYKQANTQT